MRIVAWNCNQRFDQKYPLVRDLNFDVAVVLESGPFSASLEQKRSLTQVMRLGTGVTSHTKHIGVLAQDPWTVEELDPFPDQPWILPVKVSGPTDFTLLAVWTLGPSYVNNLRYVDQVAITIEEILPTLKGPVVLAGDFNAPGNLTLDRKNAGRINKHHENVAALNGFGLVSAFSSARGKKADPLKEPTYFHTWNEGRPFHLDHVFLPKQWAKGVEVEVGTYDDWVASGISDHTPVIVDVKASAAFVDAAPAAEPRSVTAVDETQPSVPVRPERKATTRIKKASAREAFDANFADAEKLVDVVRMFENQRTRKMRAEMRARVGDALKIPNGRRDGLDWITNDDVTIIFSPESFYSRADFSDEALAPLLRQAIVAGCAAVETFVSDRAQERLKGIDQDNLPKRLKDLKITVGDWLSMEEQYTRRGWALRSVAQSVIEQHASAAPSSIGIVMSMVGIDKVWKQVDERRSVASGASEEALTAIVQRRNKIAHTLDRRGRSREKISVAQTEEVLTTIRRIVEALDDVTRA